MKQKLHLLGYIVTVFLLFVGCRDKIKNSISDVEINTPTVMVNVPVPGELGEQPNNSDTEVLSGAITPEATTPGDSELEVDPNGAASPSEGTKPTTVPGNDSNSTPTQKPTVTEDISDTTTPENTSNDSLSMDEVSGNIRILENNSKAQIDEAGTIVGIRISGKYIAITGVVKEVKDSIVVPAKIEGYEVITIDSFAFSNTKAKTIEFESGIRKIDSKAFYGNSKVVKISIPASVTTIGQNALGNCANLLEINVDKGNKDYKLEGGILYNYEITSLIRYPAGRKNETLTLPDTVIKIEDGAFSMSKNLAFIIFPNSLKSIGYEAFAGCSLLSIEIPQTIDELKAYAFADCYRLYSITIPKSVRVIPEGAFSGCENVFRVNFLGHIDQISYSAFSNCTMLNSVNFASKVDVICALSFAFCTSLRNVVIPEGTVEIGDMAFYNCSNLIEIQIPASVTYFGEMIFDQAKQVKVLAAKGSRAISFAILNQLNYQFVN